MSKYLIIFILLSLIACKTELRKTIEKHPNGKVSVEYVYPDKTDTTQFTYIAYDENGQVLFKCNVLDMKFVGEKINYYDNGNIYTIEKLNKATAFDDSLYDCEITQNDINGKLQYWYAYKNGSRNGIGKSFDTNGKVIETTDWINGKKNGKVIEYYPNGKISSLKSFRNDTAVDFIYTFDENGDTLKYSFHQNGKISLPYKKWLGDGLTLTGTYINIDHKKALWRWFDKDNKEIKRKTTSETKVGLIAPE